METKGAEVMSEKTSTRVITEDTVGHTEMVDIKVQPTETKPMAINMKLYSKTKWEAALEDMIQRIDGGEV